MFLSYTERVKRTEDDINSRLKWLYSEIEKKCGSKELGSSNIGDVISVVKLKDVPCGIYGNFVKINGIVKFHNTNTNITEYKLRGFIIRARTYSNYLFRQVPLDIRAKMVDHLCEEIKTM